MYQKLYITQILEKYIKNKIKFPIIKIIYIRKYKIYKMKQNTIFYYCNIVLCGILVIIIIVSIVILII